jgi:hypothetical protein
VQMNGRYTQPTVTQGLSGVNEGIFAAHRAG